MPFNNDHFIIEEFLKLKKQWNINTVIETGSYEGDTSSWFADNYEFAHTIEINKNAKLSEVEKSKPKLKVHYGSSDIILNSLIPSIDGRIMFFLDAHWGDHWPLLNELKAIKKCKVKPVIAIHDFKCHNLGYDSYKNTNLDFEYVRKGMEEIYGKSGFAPYTNSPDKAAGARRGVGYFIPVE